jgi:hypothetical protein
LKRLWFTCIGAVLAASASAIVFPTGAHAANNAIPFNAGASSVQHQVFASTLFGTPSLITSIGFAPGVVGIWNANLTLRLGYTNAIPGLGSASGGLAVPTVGGGGGPNSIGAMSTFFSNPTYSVTITSATSTSFSEFVLPGSFVYNPASGNLLVEIVVSNPSGIGLSVSRAAGSAESSRAYNTTTFGAVESPGTATRMDFNFTPVPEPTSMFAFGLGVVALSRCRRRRRA